MNIYLDCYPCVLRQALDAARRTGVDEHIQFNIIRGILRELLIIPAEAAPPEITARIHRLIKQESGIDDPYQDVKRRDNEMVIKHYPRLKKIVTTSASPLLAAVKLAIAGNIIDSGASGGAFDLNETIEESLQAKLDGNDYRTFEGAIHDASRILYLGDNAGEIVFDRILIEEIHKCTEARVTFVVKGEPILNDATLEDDLFIGMDTIAEVITNGYDAPATILSRSSRELQETWKDADLIISKGQGNYESLSDVRGNIFFLLKVKCSVLATDVGSDVGQSILRKGIGRAVSRIEAPPM
jgi:hypothetical protein